MTRTELIKELQTMHFSEAALSDVRSCRIVEVICIEFTRGLGVPSEPIRVVTQWRTRLGELIAEVDPCKIQRGESE